MPRRKLWKSAGVVMSATALVAGVVAVAATAANAASLTATATDDVTASAISPNTVVGGTLLRVDATAATERQTFMQFNVTGIPAGQVVTAATLRLVNNDANTGNVLVNSVANTWDETTTTWNNKPALGQFRDSGALAPGAGVGTNYNVTSAVTANGAVSFMIRTNTPGAVLTFGARDNANTALRPRLTLTTAVPKPNIAVGHWRNHPSDSGVAWAARLNATEATFGPLEGHWRDYLTASADGQLQQRHLDALAAGKRLFVNWQVAGGSTWAQVASGARDSVITAAADQWAANCTVVDDCWVTFNHEPENDVGKGTAADYNAMFRHVYAIWHAHAPKVKVAWVVMGFDQAKAAQFWPGGASVDIVAHDPYISPTTDPALLAQRIIDRSKALLTLPGAAGKPVVIAEYGADLPDPGTAAHRAAALDGIANRIPEIAAAGVIELDMFDALSNSLSCDNLSCVDAQAYKRVKTATE